jgi:hypothetical protein
MKIKLILFFILLLTTKVFSQPENENATYSPPQDSILKFMGINPQLNIPDQVFEYDLKFKFWHQQSSMLTEGNESNLWLRTEMALTYSGGFNANDLITVENFSEPLYKRYLENQKINPLYYVLGMAQTAAVGYMAYQHIKKYGFFK